jgi:hypothetical protein
MKTDVNVPSKIDKQKNKEKKNFLPLTKRAGSGLVIHGTKCHGFTTLQSGDRNNIEKRRKI